MSVEFIFIFFALFVYGTIFGSFINVVIYRTQKKEQFVKGRSHCMSCGHTLAWYDLFPIFSWVFLGGKCRYCKKKITPRYAIVEAISGLSYAAAFVALGVSLNLLFAIILFPILLCLSFFDIDTGEIEYWCPISITVLGIAAVVLSFTDYALFDATWKQHLLGSVVISVPFAVLAMLGGMGGADVQLMAAAGLLLGWNILPAALIGIVLGAVFGVIMKLSDKTDTADISDNVDTADNSDKDDNELTHANGTVIKFAPFLAIGIAVSFLYGEKLINLYLGLFEVHS